MIDLSVYLVTDPEVVGDRALVDVVRAAVAGGVTAVQVREKSASARHFAAVVAAIAGVLPDRVALVVNDRVDVFLAARAAGIPVAGVHVGQDDLPVAAVRALVGPSAVVGLSATEPDELAATAGADYVGIGTIRATSTKPDAPPALGVDGFAARAALTALPTVAIGGITVADVAPLRAAGAAGVAVVSAICAAADPSAAARAFAAASR
jgi:thiamine-phosphate pyrophosphorylase